MQFKAKEAYLSKEIVNEYDKRRFCSLKGEITDFLEKKLIERALRLTGVPLGAQILDLPCGTGRLSIFLAKKGYTIFGGDISEEMVKKSTDKANEEGVSNATEFKIINAEKIDYSDRSFDAIVSLRFFGHTPPSIRMNILKEMKRVSKKYVVVCYYNEGCFQEILRRKKRRLSNIPWYPVKLKEAEGEFQQAGLKKLKHFYLMKWISESLLMIGERL